MADRKAAEEVEGHDFLYMEEVNSNDGTCERLAGINPSATVEDLKKAIASKLHSPASWNTISVVFGGQELSNLDATLSSFEVEECDTVYFTRSVTPAVDPPPYTSKEIILKTVFFKHIDGRNFTLHNIPISWTIGRLKDSLVEKKSVNLEKIRFLSGGKPLVDEKTLEHYGLGKDCTIHMVMRQEGGALKF